MDYDVVIATRNRPDALRLSIPLILRQSHKPRQLIIVDSSDVHASVRHTVAETVGDFSIKLEILHTRPNLPHQRNVGLELVKSPVVMFPDDDSLWWPGVAQAIMRIYELDKNHDIGGVCAAGAKGPPPEANLGNEEKKYKMRLSDRILRRVAKVRYKFDEIVCPSPFHLFGRSCWDVRPTPTWLEEENAVLVEYMTGFRMSFRTDIIRETGFDENLGSQVGWALCEDVDACFRVMKNHLLIGARNAQVYHNKFPARRAEGFKLGFINALNYTYVVCCHAPQNSKARLVLKRFILYKILSYCLGLNSQFGRDRLRGALRGFKIMNGLIDFSVDSLPQKYLEVCRETLKDE